MSSDLTDIHANPRAANASAAERRRIASVRVIAFAVLAIVAAVGWALSQRAGPAPNVTFTAIDGKKFSTNDLRGKVVLVNFWATSCTTCVHEMPKMVETYQRFHDSGLDFVAVAMAYDPPNYVVNYAETRKLPFRVAIDADGNAARVFGDVQLTPTTFVLDKQGRIVKKYLGEPDFAELHRLIERQLAQNA